MYRNTLFSSESVTEGHPDKICDQVSDSVLDAYLAGDPGSRVACECATTTGLMLVMGEITSRASVNVNDIARQTLREIGYTNADYGIDADTCCVMVTLDRQSGDIAMGVDNALEVREDSREDIGAGDQGMVFGFACDETEDYMPLPIALAHKLTRRLAQARKSGDIPYLRPDGKSQVTVRYDAEGRPCGVPAVVLSTQHDPDVDMKVLHKDILDGVIREALPANLLDADTKYFINPTGRFVIGGPHGDSGLTGRKIIVDSYGGYAPHGGGAFSGKDPTKVDRSAAYAARYIAKNVVAAGLARHCEIQIAYAIGVAQPVSLMVDTDGTGILTDEVLAKHVRELFDLRPAAIIEALRLREPIYRQTAAYGHFGGAQNLPWEELNMVAALEKFKK